MSATVDAEKISNFFGGCPTLSVPGRTFPVNTFFLEDAIEYSKWHINGESPYARRCKLFPAIGKLLRIGAHSSLSIFADGKFQKGRPAKLDWNEDVVVQQADDDDDEDGTKKPDAPVKLEKKYGSKTVSTVNFLDDRLIPYDLVSLVTIPRHGLVSCSPMSPLFRLSDFSRNSASRTSRTKDIPLQFSFSCPECTSANFSCSNWRPSLLTALVRQERDPAPQRSAARS